MTIAFWCVLAALLLPHSFAVLSRAGTPKPEYVRDPRKFNEGLSGWHRRAHLAQLNAFEAFPAFIAGVVIAHLVGTPQARIDIAAVGFIAFRILHGAFYLADQPALRSASWQASMVCVVALFVLAGLVGTGA